MSDLAARASAIAQSARESLPAKKEQNRREMPEFTAWFDSIRKAFTEYVWQNPGRFPGGRAAENGKTIQWGDR